MNVLNFLLCSFLTISSFAKDKKVRTAYQVEKIIKTSSNREKLIDVLRSFIKASNSNRLVGTTGNRLARNFITDYYKKLPIEGRGVLKEQEFLPDVTFAVDSFKRDFQQMVGTKLDSSNPVYKKWAGYTNGMISAIKTFGKVKGVNLIWEKKGSMFPEEVLILGANYDSLNVDPKTKIVSLTKSAPGADDNGTGVSILLELMKTLSSKDIPRTIRIVFFDYGQFAYLGARSYTQLLLKDKQSSVSQIQGFLLFKMLGHDTKLFDLKKRKGNMKAYIRKSTDSAYVKDKKLGSKLIEYGKKMTAPVSFKMLSNGMNAGEHIRFWEAGIPSIVFTQDLENDYNVKNHMSENDFVETLNFKTFYSSYVFLGGAVLSWAYGL